MTQSGEIHKDNVKHRKQKLLENCNYCGTGHSQRQCPAYGKTYRLCRKTYHFNSMQVNVETPARL